MDFNSFGFDPKLLEGIEATGYTTATAIQEQAIPIILQGKDLIGSAQTGTGKTAAFLLPVIQKISSSNQEFSIKAVIIVPTRELAVQIDRLCQGLSYFTPVSSIAIYGGTDGNAFGHEQIALKEGVDIVICTPGRFIAHLNMGHVDLTNLQFLILDEADRMLDMGFKPDIDRIFKYVPRKRQTMLFSATIPGEVVSMGTSHMKLPVHVEVAPSGTAPERITQELFIVKNESKKKLLSKILHQYSGSVLLFARTRRGAAKLKRFISEMGHSVAEIHADRTLKQRKEALEGFKRGKHRILVATDIAARGIDVVGIETVINYDLPDDAENYVHRIGRTGRAGHDGRAISFATPEQRSEIRNIEKIIKTALPVLTHPEFPREEFITQTVFKSNPRQRRSKFRKIRFRTR